MIRDIVVKEIVCDACGEDTRVSVCKPHDVTDSDVDDVVQAYLLEYDWGQHLEKKRHYCPQCKDNEFARRGMSIYSGIMRDKTR